MVRRHSRSFGHKIMLLDLSDVPSIDFTTSRALEDIISDTIESGKLIFLVGACQQVCDMLTTQGVTDYFDTGSMYQNRLDALLHAKNILDS